MIRADYPLDFTHLTAPLANHSSSLYPPKNTLCHSVMFYSAVLEGTSKLTRQDLSGHLGPSLIFKPAVTYFTNHTAAVAAQCWAGGQMSPSPPHTNKQT